MPDSSELTEGKIIEYFKKLSYDKQRRFYGKLAKYSKTPSYNLSFKLNTVGLKLMARAVEYCSDHKIPYTPKKISNTKVKFIFQGASIRNTVFLGCMGGNPTKDLDKHMELKQQQEMKDIQLGGKDAGTLDKKKW